MGRDQSHQTTRENTEMPARWRRGDVAIAVVACLLATSSSRAFGNAWEEEQGGCAVNYDGPAGTCRDERGGGKTAARAAGAGRGERKGLGQATAPGASRTAAVSCVTEPNVDYPGDAVNGDLDLQTNVASAAACCDLCKATKRCRFWTFSTPERGTQPYYCWLKNKRVRPHRRAGAVGLVSGFLTKGNLGIESEAAAAEASPTRTSHAPSPGAAATSKDAGDAKVAASEEKKGKRRQKAKKMLEAAQKLYHAGKSGEAEPLLRKALKKDDMNGQVRMWLGFLLEQTGRWKDALSTYEAALAPGRIDFLSNNELAMVHNNLGLIYYKKQGRHDLAETQFRQSCDASEKAGMTAWTHSYKNLARLLEKDGRAREAMPFLDIVAQRTNNDALAFYSALLLPYVYQDAADIDEWRKQFKKNLASLAKRGLVMNDPFLMEGVPQYYLSYHGRNDASINSAIARVFRMACQTCVFRAPHTLDHKPKAAGAKVRVGFVSYYFREHSVSKMSLGLFKALDQESFYTVLFQFGFKDKTTDRLAEHMSKFHHSETWTLAQAQQMIAAEELDVLVFAEIGMDPHAYALAFGRYAPIQIAMHGHAQTSGISSLDYYVSYEGFSEPQAQTHYSEQLLVVDGYTPLPRWYDLVPFHLSPHISSAQGRASFRARFKIPSEATVYACLQTLFKVDPRMDQVAAKILRGHPGSVVVFKELPMTAWVGKQVIDRLRKTLSAEELRRVVFMPPLSDQDYNDAYLVVDVLIDSFPFGGHTTSMDAFSAGCPVVTMPTDFMSGRCTQGFLKFMGLGELVVDSIDALVETSLKLGKDRGYRERIVTTIREKLPLLIRDETSSHQWRNLLLAAGREGHTGLTRWASASGERKVTGG